MPISLEIERCERYFETSYELGTAIGTSTVLGANVFVSINAGDFFDFGNVQFKSRKRATPTVNTYSAYGTSSVLGNLGLGGNQGNAGVRYQSQLGFSLYSSNSGMSASAPFGEHWTADADL